MIKNLLLMTPILFIFLGCSGVEQNNYTLVTQNQKDGVLDNKGDFLIKPYYDEINQFNDDNEKYKHPHMLNLHWLHNNKGNEFAIVKKNSKYGIINKDSTLLLKPIYDNITSFFNGFARIEQNGKVGLINDKFEVVLKPKYEAVEEFYNNVAYIKSTAGLMGCIDKNMKVKISPQFDKIYLPINNYSRIIKDNKWGFIDDECNIISSPTYDYAHDFSNNIAKVNFNGKITYINKRGQQTTKALLNRGENF